MKRFLQLLLLLGCCATASFAQEVCDNGIDDDKDGLIDCFDPDCSKFTSCIGGYVGNDVLCEAKPSEFPKFSMELESASPNGSATHLGRVVVGDIDGDGTIEMVAVNNSSKKIVIMNGENVAGVNKVQKEITVSYEPAYEDIMLANLDGDACSEIFILGKDWKVRAYDCQLNEVWATPISLPDDPGMMGLADFNGDGKVELYAKNAIYNAHTGATIVAPDANWKSGGHGAPVAVDILNDVSKNAHLLTDAVKDDNLELVCGGSIYSVNIAGGSIKEEKKLANYARKMVHDATSVADFNNDGSLDVIASGGWTGTAPADKTTAAGYTTIFFWDVKNNTVKTFSDAFPDVVTIQNCPSPSTGSFYSKGWRSGTGRVNIADIDGDGKPNAVFVSGKFLYALKEDLTLLWRIVVNEETSGNTGCTLFDFNGDGQSEIIYRDEKYVYIIDGVAGKISDQKPCVSRTNREYPIVADVDNDGNTELCVTCRTADFYPTPGVTDPTDPHYNDTDFNKFCNEAFGNAQVRVFRSAGEPWVPARKVWNQHGYFNVNVNDNLTIPKIQQKHHLVFSNNVCTVGPNRPLNSFLNQSPFLNSKGCPKYASPDLAHVANTLVVKPPVCPQRSFDVSFQITNKGDLTLTGTVPITFYNGNPSAAGATKLNTVNVTLSNFKTGNVQTINTTVQGPGTVFTLYIVLNDGGTTVPTPIRMPNTNFIECDYDNNIISAPVNPLPVPITAETLQDNIRCTPGSTADNGSVGAYVLINGVKNTTDFTFYWSTGAVAKPSASADHTGATWTGRPENTYTVYAVHNALGCFADTTDTKVVKINKTVDPDIFSVHDYDQCTPPNGAVRVVVNDGNGDGVGEDPDNYSYVWYEGNDIFSAQIGINDSLSGLSPIAYTVLVTHKATSCQVIESFSIPDKTSIPTVTATATQATCSNPTSGSVTASVNNVTTGYTFKWYKGENVKATADFTGATYANRPVGKYTVIATNDKSHCVSAPVTVEVTQTAAPVVVATLISDQTSCDPAQPTGSASAAVGGTTAGYTFEWFTGQNTLTANRVATTALATGLSNTIYTVKATSTATGCSAIAEITIGFNVQTPSITAVATNPTVCTNPNGSIEMSVSLDAVSDYTFSWYNGASVKATTDYASTAGTLSGLAPGQYTVKAINNLRHCTAQPVVVTLTNDAPVVSFTLLNVVRPSTCNDSNGSMEVSASATGNLGGFDFEWRAGQLPFQGPALPATATNKTSAISGLMTGAYTVIASNRDNGCESSHVYDLPFDDAQILSFLSKTNVDNCVPGNNGDITVELTKTTGFVETDYRIDVFEGANDLGASGAVFRTLPTSNGVTQYQASSPLQPGKYTFVAITTNPARNTFNCRSVPVTVDVLKDTKNPVFTATVPANNMTCSPTVGSGQIAVNVTGPTNNLSDYTFAWHEGVNTTDPALGMGTSGVVSGTNGSTANNLPAGSYTVVVTKTAGASAGCESHATYEIFDNHPTLTLTTADLAVTDISRCDMMTNGAVQVNFVTENGAQFPATNYSYAWYNDSPSGPQLIVGSTAAQLTGLGTGKVYVQPTNTTSLCTTPTLVEATILDKTTNTVSVALVGFTEPTLCLKPANVLGDLTAEGSGSSTTGYTYSWFAGAATTDPPLSAANVTGANGEIAQNLLGGTYTVEVLNNSTQCKTTDTYVLPTDRRPVLLTASAEPLTVCYVSPLDGSIFAAVTSGSKNDYTYNWYVNTVKASPDFTGTAIAPVGNLGVGRYIVIATDNMDATCSVSDTVTVMDRRIMPVATALPAAPVTICDPARPDGAASVSVGGDISNFTFHWYSGGTPTGASFYTGADVGGMKALTYSVIATSIVTGCSDTTQVTIMSQPAIVPLPDIDVLSLVTSCVEGNGAVSAAVGGNTSDYVFNWYNGTLAKPSPDFTGEIYDNLIVGNYSVTATSRITGCISALVTAPVGDSLLYPEFTYTTTAAMCMRDASEPGNGLAAVFVTNGANIESIEWQTDGGTVTGPILDGVRAGTYTVTVTTFLGCSTSKDIVIKPEIHPYNGISRNGDSQNELFLINCIESFPLNSVKIFNRAGTLVYEADGYDNSAVFFDGKSNKGLSVMGTDLPGGTYFYIIDKHDGSKPLAGYLELIH
jgi:hypothetical protein